MDLARSHLRLLKSLERGETVIRTDKYSVKDLEYLRANLLIEAIAFDKPGDYFYQAEITEKGKAVLYQYRARNRRANIALFFSALAILISLLSIAVQIYSQAPQ